MLRALVLHPSTFPARGKMLLRGGINEESCGRMCDDLSWHSENQQKLSTRATTKERREFSWRREGCHWLYKPFKRSKCLKRESFPRQTWVCKWAQSSSPHFFSLSSKLGIDFRPHKQGLCDGHEWSSVSVFSSHPPCPSFSHLSLNLHGHDMTMTHP